MARLLRSGNNIFSVGSHTLGLPDKFTWISTSVVAASGIQFGSIKFDPNITRNRFFAGRVGASIIDVYDATSYSLLTSIVLTNGAGSIYTVTFDIPGDRLIAIGANGYVFIIDPVSLTVTSSSGKISAVGSDTIDYSSYDPVNNYLWCANFHANNVLLIDVATFSIVATLTDGIVGPGSAYVDLVATNNRVIIGNYSNTNYVEFDRTTFVRKRTVNIGKGNTNQICADPVVANNRLYAGASSGLIYVLDATTLGLIATMPAGVSNDMFTDFDPIVANNRILSVSVDGHIYETKRVRS